MRKINLGLFDELENRGLVHQFTEQEILSKLLEKQQTIYSGFDPTSDSLHIGNLIPLIGLKRFQEAGHKVIVLAGGATGMVGDPSGKNEERNLLTNETIKENIEKIKKQIKQILDFDGENPAILVNNLGWTNDVKLLDFLRDIGKEFSVNAMIKKDSVKNRIDRDNTGISFTEFSYMLLQAYDFYVLARDYGCTMQIGGSDQWGNITAGVELVRRKLNKSVHGLTFPLILNSDGTKFGKTNKGAVWLNSNKTSPFEFRQFWYKTPDDDVIEHMKRFTSIPIGEINQLELEMKNSPNQAQKRLAQYMTTLIHGEDEANRVEKTAEVLFNGNYDKIPAEYLNDAFDGAPIVKIERKILNDGICLSNLLSKASGRSRNASIRDIKQNSVSLNGKKMRDPNTQINTEHLLHNHCVILKKGKRNHFLVEVL